MRQKRLEVTVDVLTLRSACSSGEHGLEDDYEDKIKSEGLTAATLGIRRNFA